MPRRGFSVVLPGVVALVIGGAWAGSALSALPPPPTVSLPTVTLPLPPPPVPVPAPPVVTVPPKVQEPPPLAPPPASPSPVDAPVDLSPATALAPPSVAPGLRGGAASSVYHVSGQPTGSNLSRQKPSKRVRPAAKADRATVVPAVRAGSPAGGAKQVVATAPTSVQGPVPEGAGFFGPIGSAFNALDVPAEVIPPALVAMAALAILLFALASAPLPARTSRAGATLVHMRGSIAVAGMAALMMALGTYLLL